MDLAYHFWLFLQLKKSTRCDCVTKLQLACIRPRMTKIYTILRSFWVRWLGVFILVAGAAFWGGYEVRAKWPGVIPLAVTGANELRLGQQTLTNPLLECDLSGNRIASKRFEPLEGVLKGIIKEKTKQGILEHASVYYRSMNSARWAGINETETFAAASLIKVPLLFVYYRDADRTPAILGDSIVYDGSFDHSKEQNIKPSHLLTVGTHTVEDLLHDMIAYSGNNSMDLLLARMQGDQVKAVSQDLGVTIQRSKIGDALFSSQDFSTFFRVLYNASYLSRDSSEKALALLTETDYRDGLVAGVPKEVTVAHKFGERIVQKVAGQEDYAELHDCGIVYDKTEPYFLCVMTRGKDLNQLSGVIRDLSTAVYNSTSRQ